MKLTSNINDVSDKVFLSLSEVLEILFENDTSSVSSRQISKSKNERYDERSSKHKPAAVRRLRHNWV